jgi:hypothetical protein
MEKRKNDVTVIVITIIIIIVRQTKKKEDTCTRNKTEQIMICCIVRAGWAFVLIEGKAGTMQLRVPNKSQKARGNRKHTDPQNISRPNLCFRIFKMMLK